MNIGKILLAFVFLLTACNKSENEYKCKENCVDLKINGAVIDSTEKDLSYLKGARFKIYYTNTSSGGMWSGFPQSDPENSLIKTSYIDANGRIQSTINVDKNALNDDYIVGIVFDDNEEVDFISEYYSIDSFPKNGMEIFSIYSKKK